jgi:hypothetical protein
MQTENNNFALLLIHAQQLESWAAGVIYEIENKISKTPSIAFLNDLKAVHRLVRTFNKNVKVKMPEQISNAVSQFCKILAFSPDADKYMQGLNYIVKSAEVIQEDNENPDLLMKKLIIISEINDKLINYDLPQLTKLKEKVCKTTKI